MFWFGKFVAALLLPPLGPLLVVLAGLVWMPRRPRFGRLLAFAGTGILLLLSVPLVAAWLTIAVADTEVLVPGTPVKADAIVLLGAGTRGFAPEYGADAPTTLSLERVRYTAWLAKALGLPVAVSGGAVYGGDPEAPLMAAILAKEFGVAPKWIEPRSRNTHENAVELAAILIPAGVRRVVVVTHGVDTRRGRREMQAAGFDVVMAPTVVPGSQIASARDFVPGISGLRGSTLALYEMLGNLRATLGGIP
jgi:uncharacterized SAM-binding protein YcdF (DUF218 family)